jgi:prophage regulatory protein
MSESTAEPPPVGILRRPQVEARTGLSRSTIYERMKQGTFPSPISLGTKAVGWIASEIDDWLDQRIKASRPSRSCSNTRN